ncbi:MAG: thrombospondin type 3 repeat-containing protein [Pseudomonadota bacterium]
MSRLMMPHLALLLCLGLPAAHAADYVVPSIGYVIPDEARPVDSGAGPAIALGRDLDARWSVEFVLRHDNASTDAAAGKWRQWSLGADALYFLSRDPAFAPYLAVGAGYLDQATPWGDDSGLVLNAGVGVQRHLMDHVSLRADLRYRHYENDLAAVKAADFGDWVVGLGLRVELDPVPVPPAPEPDQARPIDRPPSTARAETVGAPNVPAEAVPSAAVPTGDADRDGVPDGRDRCPETPENVPVDASGCPLDADGDGVPDHRDRCPETPAGQGVDPQGCPPDTDRDGVPDDRDRCPDSAAGASVDAQGCEADADRDGVPDRLDRCPETFDGVGQVDARGCELDRDLDGVVDRLDRCPETPLGVMVDDQGCEPDADGDGVVNRLDRCPDTPVGTTVAADGCEPDSDGDGVVDRRDRCPETPAGADVDGRGCVPPPQIAALQSEPARQVVKADDGAVVLLLKDVNFEFDSAKLRPDALKILAEVAQALAYRSEMLRLELAGHTCAIGTERYNQGLSERRAQAVHDYFVNRGLAPARFQVQGYGEGQPIADNRTRAGRSKNRRVELRVLAP